MSFEIVGIDSAKGSGIVTLFLSEPGGPGFRIINGDHRQMRQFLEDWSQNGYPLIDVSEDGKSLSMEVAV